MHFLSLNTQPPAPHIKALHTHAGITSHKVSRTIHYRLITQTPHRNLLAHRLIGRLFRVASSTSHRARLHASSYEVQFHSTKQHGDDVGKCVRAKEEYGLPRQLLSASQRRHEKNNNTTARGLKKAELSTCEACEKKKPSRVRFFLAIETASPAYRYASFTAIQLTSANPKQCRNGHVPHEQRRKTFNLCVERMFALL